MVDEAGLDTIGLEFFEDGGAGMAVIDAQAGADRPFFHAVFNRRGISFVGGFGMQLAKAHGLVRGDLLLAFMQSVEFVPIRSGDFPGAGNGGAYRLVHKPCDGFVGLAGLQLDRKLMSVLMDDVPYGGAHLPAKLQNFWIRVQLAVKFIAEADLLQRFHLGMNQLDVTGAQGLVQLGAGADDGVKSMEAEDTILLLESLLERRHGRVVRCLSAGEDEIAAFYALGLLDVIDNDVPRAEYRALGLQ